MFDAMPLRFTLIQLAAAPATIDAVDPGADWTVLGVAEDEALWLGAPDAGVDPAVERAVLELEPGACVCEVTDGWSGVLLRGPRRHEIFAAISPLRIAEPASAVALLQGDVLGLPAKIVVLPDAIAVLYPATAEWYVRESLRDVGVASRAGPADWNAAFTASDERLVG